MQAKIHPHGTQEGMPPGFQGVPQGVPPGMQHFPQVPLQVPPGVQRFQGVPGVQGMSGMPVEGAHGIPPGTQGVPQFVQGMPPNVHNVQGMSNIHGVQGIPPGGIQGVQGAPPNVQVPLRMQQPYSASPQYYGPAVVPNHGHVAQAAQPQAQVAQAAQTARATQAAQVAQDPTVTSRIASANAAIGAIQSVAPPPIPAVPENRPLMAKVGMSYIPGGDIVDEIRYEDDSQDVVDEVTAQRSAAQFSSYLKEKRRNRGELWQSFWENRLDVNRRVLELENQAFVDAQAQAADDEYSDEDSSGGTGTAASGYRRQHPIQVPYIYHNVGSFDVPLPRDVMIPDPQTVARVQQAQAQMRMAYGR